MANMQAVHKVEPRCYHCAMPDRRLELFQEYTESGFDGMYERTTYYRLIVGEENPSTATLEVEVEKRTSPGGNERKSFSRYQINIGDLVKFIKEHGTRADG